MLKGLLFGGVTGLVLGFTEVFFALPLFDELTRFGTDRYYTIHAPVVVTILLFDTGIGAFWGLTGAVIFKFLFRGSCPLNRSSANLILWCLMLPLALYPFFTLINVGVQTGSVVISFVFFLLWLILLGTGTLLLYSQLHRYSGDAKGVPVLTALAFPLAVLILGFTRVGASFGFTGSAGRLALEFLIPTLMAILGGYLLIRLFRDARVRKWAGGAIMAVSVVLFLLVSWQSVFSVQANVAEGLSAEKPNVLVIVLDTFRDDQLGLEVGGIPVTPELNKIAADSINYTSAITTSSWTLPSHGSLFTGLYPVAHGARFDMGRGIEREGDRSAKTAHRLAPAPTLAEILRDEGYATGAVCGNTTYLTPEFGLSRGFDFYDVRMPQVYRLRPMVDVLLARFQTRLPFDYREMGYSLDPRPKPYRAARSVVSTAQWWLNRAADTPFFLFLNLSDPHTPFLPPFEYDVFPGRAPHISAGDAMTGINNKTGTPPEIQDAIRSLYQGDCRYMDAELGRLFDFLKAQGLYENTHIYITSDHGELLGEHGWVGHGDYLYEDLVRVPLLVRHPGASKPDRVSHRVSVADVLPTLLRDLEIPPPPHIDGRPLDEPGRVVLAELYPAMERAERFGELLNRTLTVCYDGPWKLVRSVNKDGETFELYNVEDDPGETQDLSRVEYQRFVDLHAELTGVHEQSLAKAPDAASESPMLSPDRVEALRGMGYIGGGH